MGNVQVPGKLFRAALADALRVRDRGALVRLHLVRHRAGGPQERHAVRLALDVGQQGSQIGRHDNTKRQNELFLRFG